MLKPYENNEKYMSLKEWQEKNRQDYENGLPPFESESDLRKKKENDKMRAS